MNLIPKIVDSIRENYVLADKANAIADQLLTHQEEIATISDPFQLASALTGLLQEISRDKHFSVTHHVTGSASPDFDGDFGAILKRNNHFFNSVRRLAGNIGYLDLRLFPSAEESAEIAIGAMAFLANTDALIFDLRQNRGGDPSMIQLLLSYLFDEPKHINSFYYRPTDSLTQSWTWAHVPGKRMSEVPVYVLTSSMSASAAEEFAYDIQQMQRGTLVGETTVGAAHPVSPIPLSDNFVVAMPTGRPINPISQTNWEGVGVAPDIAVSAENALQTAHQHAIQTLIAQTEEGAMQTFLQWELDTANALYAPIQLASPADFVGAFGNRNLLFVDGNLVLQSPRGQQILTPIGENLFELRDGVRMVYSPEKITFIWRDSPRKLVFEKDK